MSQTSITLSEALKDHLRLVAQSDGEYSIEAVGTLHEALVYILEHPYDDEVSVSGYEDTLTDPIKVPTDTLEEVRALRDQMDARDYEEAIRERANIEARDVGEVPLKDTTI
jgi:hypothetical protein